MPSSDSGGWLGSESPGPNAKSTPALMRYPSTLKNASDGSGGSTIHNSDGWNFVTRDVSFSFENSYTFQASRHARYWAQDVDDKDSTCCRLPKQVGRLALVKLRLAETLQGTQIHRRHLGVGVVGYQHHCRGVVVCNQFFNQFHSTVVFKLTIKHAVNQKHCARTPTGNMVN